MGPGAWGRGCLCAPVPTPTPASTVAGYLRGVGWIMEGISAGFQRNKDLLSPPLPF